jgi:hypothetical protein
MCGRFALTLRPEEVEAFFALLELEDFPPRYNIAPTQPILMVMAGEARGMPGSNLPDRRALLVRWGLIPAWVKDPKSFPLLFNARSDTALQKNTYKTAMRHRRALVPASGFYEWKRQGRNKAQAYWVRPRGGGLVGFAGLMETWYEPGGSEVERHRPYSRAHAGHHQAGGFLALARLPVERAARRRRPVAARRSGLLRGDPRLRQGQQGRQYGPGDTGARRYKRIGAGREAG